MEKIINSINDFAPFVILGLGISCIIMFICLIVLFRKTSKLQKKYKRLMHGSKGKNLEQLIMSRLDSIEEMNLKTNELNAQYEKLESELNKCIQKVSIMRYRAFDNVGSDLSFSIAMLDKNNDGIMLTGIYGREDSTTYAKPIDKGISKYNLSEEEEYVLNEACGQKAIKKKRSRKSENFINS